MINFIPLLSPKPLWDFTEDEFMNHVRSLKIEPERREPKPYSATFTRTGSIMIRINRVPKFLSEAEVQDIAKHLNRTVDDVRAYTIKKKIEVRS